MRHKTLVLPLAALALGALACSIGGGDGALYKDDFSDSNTNWSTGADDTGSLDYESGEYVFRITTTKLFIWGRPHEDDLSDIHVEVKARNTGEAQDPTFGIICNYQDDQHFYYLGIGPDGYYGIVKVEGDDDIFLSDEDGQDEYLQSEAIAINADSYQVAADCANGTLTLYADGQQIATAQDASYTQGDVGLFASSFEETNAEVHFDDFVVTAIQ